MLPLVTHPRCSYKTHVETEANQYSVTVLVITDVLLNSVSVSPREICALSQDTFNSTLRIAINRPNRDRYFDVGTLWIAFRPRSLNS